ncbi:MAG: RluA family pseudouridine synthase, partial [Bdellovibrionaceae bacterium]|nr:RluA family pseudouridine synthase [Pseudobdellovibrionaceae bacterium]
YPMSTIRHHIVQAETSLLELIGNFLPLERARFLISLGAVYVNRKREFLPSLQLKSGDYVRLHENPRRFAVEKVNWGSLIVRDESDWLLIDKPAGIPVHPTLDNAIENALVQMEQTLGTKLYTTHRLDIPTSGQLALAKTKNAQSRINRFFRQGRVEKIYQATVQGHLQLRGRVEHWMDYSNRAPRIVHPEPGENRHYCALEILGYENKALTTDLKIRLITGRTHQIRAQLSALGYPIVNDVLYGAESTGEGELIHLRCEKLQFTDSSEINIG